MTSYPTRQLLASFVALAALGAAAGAHATQVALPASLPETGTFSVAPFTFTGVGGTFVIDAATYGNAIPGENNLLINGTETFDIHATAPIYAFGFDMFQPSADQPSAATRVACYFTCSPGPFTVELRSGTTLVESFTFTPATDAITPVYAYVGAQASQAFDSIAIIDVNGSIDDEYFANFRYGTSPVPLPAAAWLMAPLLGGLLVRRRATG